MCALNGSPEALPEAAIAILSPGQYAETVLLTWSSVWEFWANTRPERPGDPVSPFGPCGPAGPAGSWPALKSAAMSQPFLTFAPVIALFLICAAPTEFFGTISRLAACPSGVVPNRATTSAVTAIVGVILDLNIVCCSLRSIVVL